MTLNLTYDPDYAERVATSLVGFVRGRTGEKVTFPLLRRGTAPQGLWHVKQKSQLRQCPPVVKVRPIVQHHRHPCVRFLRRVARAISLVVQHAREAVRSLHPNHCPIWGMHAGTKEWLSACQGFGAADY